MFGLPGDRARRNNTSAEEVHDLHQVSIERGSTVSVRATEPHQDEIERWYAQDALTLEAVRAECSEVVIVGPPVRAMEDLLIGARAAPVRGRPEPSGDDALAVPDAVAQIEQADRVVAWRGVDVGGSDERSCVVEVPLGRCSYRSA